MMSPVPVFPSPPLSVTAEVLVTSSEVEAVMLTLADDPRVHKDPPPQFHVLSYADSAIQVRLRVYVDYADMFMLNWDLNKQIKKLFETHNIEIPFSQIVLHKAP